MKRSWCAPSLRPISSSTRARSRHVCCAGRRRMTPSAACLDKPRVRSDDRHRVGVARIELRWSDAADDRVGVAPVAQRFAAPRAAVRGRRRGRARAGSTPVGPKKPRAIASMQAKPSSFGAAHGDEAAHRLACEAGVDLRLPRREVRGDERIDDRPLGNEGAAHDGAVDRERRDSLRHGRQVVKAYEHVSHGLCSTRCDGARSRRSGDRASATAPTGRCRRRSAP